MSLESLEQRSLLATLFVTTGADAGAGSLRAAIATANANGQANTIMVKNVANISLASPVTYTSSRNLSLVGQGATIRPAAGSEQDFDLFRATGGGNLSFSNLTVRDGATAIEVNVPAARTGTLSVSLTQVNLTGNGRFGLEIDDQIGDADGLGADSAASIDLVMTQCNVTNNGFTPGDTDLDGVRVDEGGVGGIVARLTACHIDGNGADGLELDERGTGDSRLTATNSSFDNNGPNDPEDTDDGIDLDEDGAGSIWVNLTNATINGNFDEGLDLTELADGGVNATLVNVQANGNTDEGIKIEESEAGDVTLSLTNVSASNTEDEEGVQVREGGVGNLLSTFVNFIANNNDNDGVDLGESGAGNVNVTLTNATTNENGDDGFKVSEADAGNLAMRATRLTSTENGDDGLQVDQATVGADTGTLLLILAVLNPNDDNDLVTTGVVVTQI